MEKIYVNEIIENNVLQYPFIYDDLIAVEPVLQGRIDDGHGATGPLVFIGFLAGEPVYRTTHTVAHHMEGNWIGAFQIHWPPLFPDIWIPKCELLQLDVTIRKEFGPYIPPLERDGDYDDHDMDWDDCGDESDDEYGYDYDDDCDEEEQTEDLNNSLENVYMKWADSNEEWVEIDNIVDYVYIM